MSARAATIAKQIVSGKDQRREQRRKAAGPVSIRFTDPQPKQVDGDLIDISTSGFRMSHRCVSLESGQIVEFTHTETAGHARVMWNRVLDEHVETGFLVIDTLA